VKYLDVIWQHSFDSVLLDEFEVLSCSHCYGYWEAR